MHSCHTRKERSELAEWETGSLLGETFPNGVNYKIGSSSLTEDWNYIQWSVFGGTLIRPAVAAVRLSIDGLYASISRIRM